MTNCREALEYYERKEKEKTKDDVLLEKSKELKEKLEAFKYFMIGYERDDEQPLFNEHGKKRLDYVISEFDDIISSLE